MNGPTMTAQEHRAAAERLLVSIDELYVHDSAEQREVAAVLTGIAQVHATLADAGGPDAKEIVERLQRLSRESGRALPLRVERARVAELEVLA